MGLLISSEPRLRLETDRFNARTMLVWYYACAALADCPSRVRSGGLTLASSTARLDRNRAPLSSPPPAFGARADTVFGWIFAAHQRATGRWQG